MDFSDALCTGFKCLIDSPDIFSSTNNVKELPAYIIFDFLKLTGKVF